MTFFARLLNRLARRPAAGRARATTGPALALERLEERWTPAIVAGPVEGDVTRAWIIDTGKDNSTIEIIDDLATNTTYYKVGKGAEQVLGTAGFLQNLSIDMGAGNDRVTFTVRNGAGVNTGLYRTVDMGAGNDVLTINTSVSGGAFVQYLVNDDSGADQYSFGGAISNGGSLRVDLTDTSGNDTYSSTANASGAESIFSLYVDDWAGNDKYTFTGTAADKARLYTSIFERAGKDSYTVNATATGLEANVNYLVNDLLSDDKYVFNGSALNNGAYNVNLTEGGGNDSYSANVTVGTNESKFSFSNTDSAGNDKYAFAGGVTGHESMYYVAITDNAGKDTYTLGGTAATNGRISYEIFDQTGNDAYMVKGSSASGADFYVKLTDADGADKYTTSGGASSSSFGINVIDYDAAGSDSFAFTPSSGAGAIVSIAVSLGGGNNSFNVKGAQFTAGSVFTVGFDAGAGKDSATIDDVAIIDSEATYEINLGDNADKLTLKLDGQPKTGPAVSNSTDEVKNATYKINLGAGNDVFSASVASTWSLASNSAAGAGLILVVHGDEGNDKLTFATNSSKPFAFSGPASRFYLNLFGDDGDDAITVNVGSFSVLDVIASDSLAFLTVQGGAGKDAVSVAATLLASQGEVNFNIDLGVGDDTLTTSIVTTKTTSLPTITGGFFGSEGVNKISIKKNVVLPDNIFDFVNYTPPTP